MPCAVLPSGKMPFSIGRLEAVGLPFLPGMQVVEPPYEEEVSDLLHHFEGVGNAARPERIPDAVNLVFQFASNHDAAYFAVARSESCLTVRFILR